MKSLFTNVETTSNVIYYKTQEFINFLNMGSELLLFQLKLINNNIDYDVSKYKDVLHYINENPSGFSTIKAAIDVFGIDNLVLLELSEVNSGDMQTRKQYLPLVNVHTMVGIDRFSWYKADIRFKNSRPITIYDTDYLMDVLSRAYYETHW